MRHFAITIFMILFGILSALGQNATLKLSVYFDTDQSIIKPNELQKLIQLWDSVADDSILNIYIFGHTDNDADSLYNIELSKKRCHEVRNFFISNNINQKIFKINFFGENKPISPNKTDEEKQKNRRVDISILYKKSIPIDSSQFLPSIFELYKQIEQKPQQFSINNNRDTFIRCQQGTIINIKANTFKISRKCMEKCITFEVKEAFLPSDMILNNLSTMSNGQLLETQGMLYLNAKDCKNNDLKINKGSELIIFQPSDTIIENAKIFNGNRTAHDSDMNWTVNYTSVLNGFSMEKINFCNNFIDRNVNSEVSNCNFSFFRIKRLPQVFKGIFKTCIRVNNRLFRKDLRICRTTEKLIKAKKKNNEKQIAHFEKKLDRKNLRRERIIKKFSKRCKIIEYENINLENINLENSYDCEQLNKLFKQYGVYNYKALFYLMNKELMDKYGVDNMKDLQDSMKKASIRKIEENYKSNNISFEDVKYYTYNSTQLGWKNVDVFAKIKPENLSTLTVNINANNNTDCKLVFRDRQFVIPAVTESGIYQFKNVPKGERVWIVTLMYQDGKPYLSMEEATVDNKEHGVKFEALSLQELKVKLELMNK